MNIPIRNVTGCWTITAEGTLSFMRSCRSRLQWQRGMSALSEECWNKDTLLRSVMPTVGHCSISLLPKEKRDVFEYFWSMEVWGFVFFSLFIFCPAAEVGYILKSSIWCWHYALTACLNARGHYFTGRDRLIHLLNVNQSEACTTKQDLGLAR